MILKFREYRCNYILPYRLKTSVTQFQFEGIQDILFLSSAMKPVLSLCIPNYSLNKLILVEIMVNRNI